MAAPDAQTAFLSVPCNQLWLFDDVWPPTHVTCTSSGLCPQGRGSDPGPETNAVPADSAGVFAGSLNQHNQTERGARLREGARHVTGDRNRARETPDAGLPRPRRGGAASRGRAGPSRRARGGDKRLSWASAAAAEPASWPLEPFCSSLPSASPGLPASADVVELAAADIVAGRQRLTPNATFAPRVVRSACPSEPKRSCRKAVGRRMPGARGGSRAWPEAAGEGGGGGSGHLASAQR